MKKKFCSLILLFPHFFSFAQEVANDKKFELGFSLSSPQEFTVAQDISVFNNIAPYGTNNSFRKDKSMFSYGIFGKYYFQENDALKFGFGLCEKKTITHREDTGTYPHLIQDEISKQNSFYIDFGLQKNKSFDGFRIYTGIDILFYSFGHFSDEYAGYAVDFAGNSWNEYSSISHPGGYSFGLGESIGANIFIYKGISFSPEVSFALLYEKTGGESVTHVWSSGFYNTNDTSNLSYKAEKINFSKIGGSLNISYTF